MNITKQTDKHYWPGLLLGVLTVCTTLAKSQAADDWKSDPIWYDGMVEKATYKATRVVYGEPRTYTAIFFTNKEQHDKKTLTKASAENKNVIEVFKHNQIEVIPTPNYDYKYTTTSHLVTDSLKLTRLDVSSQEFCGTSFKQYLLKSLDEKVSYDYFGFSYMPESGRQTATIESNDRPTVAFNSLPVYLRGFDFTKANVVKINLLPDQKSNKATSPKAEPAELRYAGEPAGADKADRPTKTYAIELYIGGEKSGTFEMAKDRQHVMVAYRSADGQQAYELASQERANYWTIGR